MNCIEARDQLLEADHPALRGEPTTELGRHVATCAACGELARGILDAEAALDRALARRPERPPQAASSALPRSRRWLPVARWGALAAAIVVLLLVPRQPPPAGQARVADQPDPAAVDVDVSTGAGRTAVVLRTADPAITVVWFFQD